MLLRMIVGDGKPIRNSAIILLIPKGLTPEGLPGPAEVLRINLKGNLIISGKVFQIHTMKVGTNLLSIQKTLTLM